MRNRLIFVLLLSLAVPVALASPAHATSATRVAAAVDNVLSDIQDLEDAASIEDIDGVGYACSALADDADAFLTMTRPSRVPKKSWQRLLAGMRHFAIGGSICERATVTLDSDLLSTAIDHFNLGTEQIKQANKAFT